LREMGDSRRKVFKFTASYVAFIVGSISAAFSGPKSAGSLPETAVGNRAYLNSI